MSNDLPNCPPEMKIFMELMSKHKVIQIDGPMFRLHPSFNAIMQSQFKQNTPAVALTLAIKSYCPGALNMELAVMTTGVMTILKMSEHPMFHEIKAEIDRDIPPGSVPKGDIKELEAMIQREKTNEPCSCENPYCYLGDNRCLNCRGIIDRSDLM